MSARRIVFNLAIGVVALVVLAGCASEARSSRERVSITLYTTTSVYDSGLLDALLPPFERQSGIHVRVVAVGTGEALASAKAGNADAVLVHDPEAERSYAKEGVITEPLSIARNYFIIVGPKDDPANISSAPNPVEAFRRIALATAPFVSRGDNSGTHARERALWKTARVDPVTNPSYKESGQGMGETLRIASEKKAYCLCDAGTFLAAKGLALVPLYRKRDPELENVYTFWLVARPRGAKADQAARALRAYLASPKLASLISRFSRSHARSTYPDIAFFEPVGAEGEAR